MRGGKVISGILDVYSREKRGDGFEGGGMELGGTGDLYR